MPSSGCQTCALDRKSTRLNSSHGSISYAVFCLKKNNIGLAIRHRRTHDCLLRHALVRWRRDGFGLLVGRGDVTVVRSRSSRVLFFFFLKARAPPDLPPFPLPGPLLL